MQGIHCTPLMYGGKVCWLHCGISGTRKLLEIATIILLEGVNTAKEHPVSLERIAANQCSTVWEGKHMELTVIIVNNKLVALLWKACEKTIAVSPIQGYIETIITYL